MTTRESRLQWQLLRNIATIALILSATPSLAHQFHGLDIGFGPGFADTWRLPTEHNVGEAKEILAGAPEGGYYTTGSERAFLGAALAPGVDSITVLEGSLATCRYAAINAALLAASTSIEDYRWLRLEATPREVKARLAAANIDPDLAFALESWMILEFQHDQKEQKLALLNQPPGRADQNFAFKDANYLYDVRLYQRLAAIAKAKRIAVLHVDLSDQAKMTKIIDHAAKQGERIAVLDFTDLWYDKGYEDGRFLTQEQSAWLIREFQKIGDPATRLLFTSWYAPRDGRGVSRVKDPRFKERTRFWRWNYFGFTFGLLAEPGLLGDVLRELNRSFKYFDQAPPYLHRTLNATTPEKADAVTRGQLMGRIAFTWCQAASVGAATLFGFVRSIVSP